MKKITDFLFGGKRLYITVNVIMLIITLVLYFFGLLFIRAGFLLSISGIIFLLILNVLGYFLGTSRSWGFGVILSFMGGFIGTFIAVHKTDKFIDRRYLKIVDSLFIAGIWLYFIPLLAMIALK